MRVQFDAAMRLSDELIVREHRAKGTARRLREENDQLLDMLLDINEQPRAPPRLRVNLDPSGIDAPVTGGPDPEAVRQQLQDLRDAAARGELSPEEYTERADKLHNSQAIRQTLKPLAALDASVPHSTRDDAHRPVDGIDLSVHAPGFMSPAHEEEYLAAMDQLLDQPGFDPAVHRGRPLPLASALPQLSDKQLTIKNPDSVYNWLRKHQPQVFLQDKDALHHENMSEKSAPHKANPSHRKGVKRESAVAGESTPGPREHNEEDESALDAAKGRRKTGGGGEDDTAYRPKGGSSRPTKRKREDGDTPGAKGKKKSRPSAATPAA
jgi:hypothetical protein